MKMDEMSGATRRDQNYQNPLNLLQDNAFVTAVLVLCFIAILEIVIGFFYSTYCSYPSMLRSDASRRRVQYCAMAGGLGQYEQTMNEQSLRSHEEEMKQEKEAERFHRDEEMNYSIPVENTPPSPSRTSRRNSIDIQSVISSVLSDNEDEKDAVSITSNDDSMYAEDDNGDFLFDKAQHERSVRGSRSLQHLRILTQGSATSGSRRKPESEKNKYSQV